MKPNERLHPIAEALAKRDPYETLDPEEVAKIAADVKAEPERLVGLILYAKARLTDKLSKVKAFEKAFPERCIATESDGSVTFETNVKPGDRLHKSTIVVKAQRLEASAAYKKVFTILQTSLYVAYATDRLLILDEAFRLAMSDRTSDREKPQYMKLFLEETRKPAEAMKMELNMQVTNNNISVVDVEERMSDIAKRLSGMDASKIIDMVHNDSTED